MSRVTRDDLKRVVIEPDQASAGAMTDRIRELADKYAANAGEVDKLAAAIEKLAEDARIEKNHYSMEEVTKLLKGATEDERDRCIAIVEDVLFDTEDRGDIISRIKSGERA